MKLTELKTKISDFYHKDNKHKAIAIVAALVPVLLVGGVSVAVALNNPPAPAKTTNTAVTSTNATDDEKKEDTTPEAQEQSAADATEQTEGASTDASNPSSSDTSSSPSASTAPSSSSSSTSSNTSSTTAVTATSPLPPAPAGKKGHWEKKLVKAAYDEPVYEKVQKTRVLAEGYTRNEPTGRSYYKFRVDGFVTFSKAEAAKHSSELMNQGKSDQHTVLDEVAPKYYPPVIETYYEWVQTGTKHHDAVYENVWIDD